ncbi:heme exporter protein CcmB [Marinomonas sp. THO17]
MNSLLFFLLVIVLFPLGIDSSEVFLSKAAGGIIWCATALACLLSVEALFKEDYHDGSLEQWVVSGLSLPILVLLKVILHSVMVILALIIMLPLLSQMLFLPANSFWPLLLSLLLAVPSLFLLGGIGAAVTVSLRQGAVLMLLIVLPLYVPIIIFATSVMKLTYSGLPYDGSLAILAAMFLFCLVLSPWMTAICIKASVS